MSCGEKWASKVGNEQCFSKIGITLLTRVMRQNIVAKHNPYQKYL